jgi:hypothetical protein
VVAPRPGVHTLNEGPLVQGLDLEEIRDAVDVETLVPKVRRNFETLVPKVRRNFETLVPKVRRNFDLWGSDLTVPNLAPRSKGTIRDDTTGTPIRDPGVIIEEYDEDTGLLTRLPAMEEISRSQDDEVIWHSRSGTPITHGALTGLTNVVFDEVISIMFRPH